jgi:hypothetical protein
VELAIVASGARLDLGDPEAALAALDTPVVRNVRDDGERRRVAVARAAAWDALGRPERARQVLADAGADDVGPQEEILVVDLEDEEEDEP